MHKIDAETCTEWQSIEEDNFSDFSRTSLLKKLAWERGRGSDRILLCLDTLLSVTSKNAGMESEWRVSKNRCLISLRLAPKEARSQFGILMLYLSLSTDGYFYWYYFVYLVSRKVSSRGRCLSYGSTFLGGSGSRGQAPCEVLIRKAKVRDVGNSCLI